MQLSEWTMSAFSVLPLNWALFFFFILYFPPVEKIKNAWKTFFEKKNAKKITCSTACYTGRQKFIVSHWSTNMLYHFILLNKGNKQNHLYNLLFSRQMDCLKENIDHCLPFNKAHGTFLSIPIASFWNNYLYICFPQNCFLFFFCKAFFIPIHHFSHFSAYFINCDR